MRAFSAMLIPLLLTVSAAAQEAEVTDAAVVDVDEVTEIDGGMASYYGNELAGNRTASGERMKVGSRTAAHRTLPFGTLVEVENLRNGRTVVVRINDRGPFIKGRVIDLARGAATELGMVSSGTASVRLSVLDGKTKPPAKMCG